MIIMTPEFTYILSSGSDFSINLIWLTAKADINEDIYIMFYNLLIKAACYWEKTDITTYNQNAVQTIRPWFYLKYIY